MHLYLGNLSIGLNIRRNGHGFWKQHFLSPPEMRTAELGQLGQETRALIQIERPNGLIEDVEFRKENMITDSIENGGAESDLHLTMNTGIVEVGQFFIFFKKAFFFSSSSRSMQKNLGSIKYSNVGHVR